jgi:hypothetical protein
MIKNRFSVKEENFCSAMSNGMSGHPQSENSQKPQIFVFSPQNDF